MLQDWLSLLLSIDKHLILWISTLGHWTYLVLFLVIFCETGLVVTPFLPGDSLLFVAGSVAAQQASALELPWLMFLLILASILGNQLNYVFGRWFGPRVFRFRDSWLLNQRYLHQAHQFYEHHGKATIILARFLPIIRTFAPFVAGVGSMNSFFFTLYNALSAVLWVGLMLIAGYFLGSLPFFQAHLSLVIYGIIVLSFLPALLSWLSRKVIGSTS